MHVRACAILPVLLAACADIPRERVTAQATGSGGASVDGGALVDEGADAESPPPPIDPLWRRLAPGVRCVDAGVDASDNVFIAGYGDDTSALDGFPAYGLYGFLAKLDPQGKVLWLHLLASGGDLRGIAVEPTGEVFVLSTTPDIFYSSPPPDPPAYERIFLDKIGPDGALLWARSFGAADSFMAPMDVMSAGLAVDANGEAIVAASYSGHLATDVGEFDTAWMDYDVFLARFDAGGTMLQGKSFNVAGYQGVGDITVSSVGNIVVTGGFDGGAEFDAIKLLAGGAGTGFVAQFSADLEALWAKALPSDGATFGEQAAIGTEGDVLVAGTFNGALDLGGGPSPFVGASSPFWARFDSGGGYLDSQRYATTATDSFGFAPRSVALATNAAGEIAFATQHKSPVNLGGGLIPSTDLGGGLDAALATYAPFGAYVVGSSVGGFGNQETAGAAISSSGRRVWVVNYWGALEWNGEVVVATPGEGINLTYGSFIVAFSP